MDGKHIDIVPPADSGSYYFNYKGRHSMVLFAIVDANYRFLLVDFGTNGRVSDGGVLQNTKFYEKLQIDDLKLPKPCSVTENFKDVPYVFVADDAFPLTINIMKPFRQAQLDSACKEIYNYRVSRARHVVENGFGILASRFCVFHTQINLEPENIVKVVKATCALHNFLILNVYYYKMSSITKLYTYFVKPIIFERFLLTVRSIITDYSTNIINVL